MQLHVHTLSRVWCQQSHAWMTVGEGYLSISTTALPYAEVHVQAQDELLKHKAHAAELAQKLAEDVATTEELQKKLAVLEDEFNAVKKGRAG